MSYDQQDQPLEPSRGDLRRYRRWFSERWERRLLQDQPHLTRGDVRRARRKMKRM